MPQAILDLYVRDSVEKWLAITSSLINFGQCLIMAYLWFRIASIMKKGHWSEFQRIKREMRGFLIGAIISIFCYGLLNFSYHQVEGAFDFLDLERCVSI